MSLFADHRTRGQARSCRDCTDLRTGREGWCECHRSPPQYMIECECDDHASCNSLQKLAKLHVQLAEADKDWRGAELAARRVTTLAACLSDFWRDLPQDREPVLQAFDVAHSRMVITLAACANDGSMNRSFEARTLVRDTLDDLCIAIATYREGVVQ